MVHAADDRLLDWTPDGRHILFVSDRMGPWSIWLVPVARGQGQGVPELVGRSTGDIRPVGFAEDGSYYYRMAYRDIDIHTAVVDLATGQLLSAPARLGVAGSDVADWSPDGKYLAYCAPSTTSSEQPVIHIRSLDADQEREIPVQLTGFEYLRWSPDQRSLLASGLVSYNAEDVLLPGRVYRIDAVTGETTILLDTKEHEVRMAELSPDGKILYYTTNRITRREIGSGQEKILFTYSPKAPWAGSALSPNGEFIAVASNEGTKEKAEGGVKKILLIPSRGGQPAELLRWDQEPASFLTQTGWSGDGKTVLFTLHREPVAGKNPKEVNEFWQVSIEGGPPRKIFETNLHMQYSRCFRVHSDGQRIVLSVTTSRGELWAMENFLPGSGTDISSAMAPDPSGTSGQGTVTPVSDSSVFVDPNTGIRFTKVKTFSGPGDVIQYSVGLRLSPNGKYLLWSGRAIPLDGSAAFDLVDMPGASGVSWSPDGRKMAFRSAGTIWLLDVNPESGRAAGSPRKLLEAAESWRGMRWSPDSEKIIFGRRPATAGDSGAGSVWAIGTGGGEPSLLTDPFSFGLVSPDGKTVATSDSWGGLLNPTPDPLWVKPVAGGEPRKVTNDIRTKCVVWSADSEWLVVSNHNDDQGIRFVRIADGHEVYVNTPGASGSGLIDQSHQGRKLLFYQTPYDTKEVLKVVSVAGGAPAELGWPHLSFDQWWAGHQQWAHDSRSIIVEGKRGAEDRKSVV